MNTINKPIFNGLLFIVQTRKSFSHFRKQFKVSKFQISKFSIAIMNTQKSR